MIKENRKEKSQFRAETSFGGNLRIWKTLTLKREGKTILTLLRSFSYYCCAAIRSGFKRLLQHDHFFYVGEFVIYGEFVEVDTARDI
jgi:hypothetical protein